MEESDPRYNEWLGSTALFDIGGSYGWDTNANFVQYAAANPDMWAGWLSSSSYDAGSNTTSCTYSNINNSGLATFTTTFAGSTCPDGFMINQSQLYQ